MFEFTYDEQSAVKADKAANRIDDGGAHIGTFTLVEGKTSEKTGSVGMTLHFEATDGGTAAFDLWIAKETGEPIFGKNFLDAMMFLMGLKSLKSEPGTVTRYNPDTEQREEVEGEVYPALCKKNVGVVLQKELYTRNDGKDGHRLNLIAVFQPETKLMVSEIKDRKTTPVKLERLLKGLKVKDSRTHNAEPAQPAMGAAMSGF